MTDFGFWLNKTAKEQQERYKKEAVEEAQAAQQLEYDEMADELLSDYMRRFYASSATRQGTWDDILETKNNNLEQYDIMQMDTDCDMCYNIESIQEDADLGYGEHYL